MKNRKDIFQVDATMFLYYNKYVHVFEDHVHFAFGGKMIKVTATALRNNLFELLAKVSKGEFITIQRNGKEVAMIVPPRKNDWRESMKIKPKLLAPPEQAFSPLEDVWEDYL
jgi:prevent-host-death family protein